LKKLLIMINSMHLGGQEKALVDFIDELCRRNDLTITLLLIEKRGEFLSRIPNCIEVKQVELPLDIFYEVTSSARKSLLKAICKMQFLTAFRLLYSLYKRRNFASHESVQYNYERWKNRIFFQKGHYDIAIDYQGQATFPTYYVSDFVDADVKYTWIHSDVSDKTEDLQWQEAYYYKYDKVFCVSKKAMEIATQKMPYIAKKVDVFYNIISVDKIVRKSSEECDNLSGNNIILTVGRLSYLKGYDVAFRVIARLCKNGYDVDYYVIGDGEQHSELEVLIKKLGMQNRIHLLGYQENPYKYLKQCDIYFQPSRHEGFCITLGEAKIFNKPIVTTDFAGAREQIEDGKTGIIIRFDEDEMYSSLSDLIDNSAKRVMFEKALANDFNINNYNCFAKINELIGC